MKEVDFSREDTAMPGMDRIELLRTFVRIVEAGSLSAAAQQLGTTQPTVSRRLQALERALGVKLLRRSTHAMQRTDDGERCYAHAKEVVARWSELDADLRGVRDAPQGVLRVVVPHAFGQQQLVLPMADYLRRYPDVQVEWLLSDRLPDFVAEDIDCAVHVGVVLDASVVAVQFADIPRIIVATPEVARLAGETPDEAALARLPWLALRTFYRDELVLTQRDSGALCRFAIRPRVSTDSLYALRAAVMQGLGAAVVSAWLVEEDIAQGRLVHLAPDWGASPLPMHLVYPHARFYPARLRHFLDVMRTAIPRVAGAVPARPVPWPAGREG